MAPRALKELELDFSTMPPVSEEGKSVRPSDSKLISDSSLICRSCYCCGKLASSGCDHCGYAICESCYAESPSILDNMELEICPACHNHKIPTSETFVPTNKPAPRRKLEIKKG